MLKNILGIVALVLSATFGVSSISEMYRQVDRDMQAQNYSIVRGDRVKHRCVSSIVSSENRVRGLGVDLVALKMEGKRIDFESNGSVTYRVTATPEEVADFYLRNGSRPCEGGVVATGDGIVISKVQNGQKVNVLVQATLRDERHTYVGYQLAVNDGPKVLGDSTEANLVQDPGSMIPPPPSGDRSGSPYYPDPQYPGMMPPPPLPDGKYQQQPYPERTYPSGSYSGGDQYQPSQYPDEPSKYSEQYQEKSGMMGGRQEMIEKDVMRQRSMVGDRSEMLGQQMMDQQEYQEETEKQMQEKMLKDMQQHMGQFIKQIEMMKKRIPMMRKKLQACGADFPEELNNALRSVDGLIEKVKNAQDPEEAMAAMETLQDAAEVFQDLGPHMGDFMRYCGMIKQADREFKRLDREFTRLESRAKTKKVDAELLTDARLILHEMKDSLAKAKASAKTDIEESLDVIETGIFENMDNLREAMSTVSMALDLTKGIKEVNTTLSDIDRKIKTLERKKVNVNEVRSLFVELKALVVEIKEMAKGKIDAQLLGDTLQQALELREQIYDALQDLGGESKFIPQVKGEQGFEFNFHDSFLQQNGVQGDSAGGNSL